MPIPLEILQQLTGVQIEVGTSNACFSPADSTPKPIPAVMAPVAWGIAPGLIAAEIEQQEGCGELDKRLRQAGIQMIPANFIIGDRIVEGRLLLGTTRERAIRLGYKLGEWALFHLSDSGVNVVYTGFNSRAR
jgi:hypothetical protein